MDSPTAVELSNGTWVLGDRLGKGGYGEVFRASQREAQAAVKFIAKSMGDPREISLELPATAQNVVPIIATGSDDQNWIVAMPMADGSLLDVIEASQGPIPLALTLEVLTDVAVALLSLEGKIVHRDIKPGNILRLNGKWCLSDFGIARYAEADTSPLTHKGIGSDPYVAPELWRGGRATSESDMYALGVVAYQLLTGSVPFVGKQHEVAQGHVDVDPPSTGAPAKLDWAILDCLKKTPDLRLTAAQFKDKLPTSLEAFTSQGALALGLANQEQRRQRDLEARRVQQAADEEKLRQDHRSHAQQRLLRISQEALEKIQGMADLATLSPREVGGWSLNLGMATISFSPMMYNPHQHLMAEYDDPFVVLATSNISVSQKAGFRSHPGRSHALWYADAKEKGRFEWYETAFVQNGGIVPLQRPVPFDAEFESKEASMALRGEGSYLVAWPFTPVDPDDLDAFVSRWALWFSMASSGELAADVEDDVRAARASWRQG